MSIVSASVFAVNMPSGPIYTSSPAYVGSGSNGVYKNPSALVGVAEGVYSENLLRSNSSGYCPSSKEFRAKIHNHRDELHAAMATDDTLTMMDKIDERYVKYYNRVFLDCFQYFKTTQLPDC